MQTVFTIFFFSFKLLVALNHSPPHPKQTEKAFILFSLGSFPPFLLFFGFLVFSVKQMGQVINRLKPVMLMVLVQIVFAGVNVLYKLAAKEGMNLRIIIAIYIWDCCYGLSCSYG